MSTENARTVAPVRCDVPKLYAVTDADNLCDPDALHAWRIAVRATSKKSAADWARENYGGEWHPSCGPLELQVASENEFDDWPDGPMPQEERRLEMMRNIGWMCEGDRQCEACERYSVGENQWAVCENCYLCADCRIAEGVECSACD